MTFYLVIQYLMIITQAKLLVIVACLILKICNIMSDIQKADSISILLFCDRAPDC